MFGLNIDHLAEGKGIIWTVISLQINNGYCILVDMIWFWVEEIESRCSMKKTRDKSPLFPQRLLM